MKKIIALMLIWVSVSAFSFADAHSALVRLKTFVLTPINKLVDLGIQLTDKTTAEAGMIASFAKNSALTLVSDVRSL